MFLRLLSIAMAAGLALASCLPGPVAAHSYTLGPLRISHPWARPSLGAVPNSAAYMTLMNSGPEADKLLEVRSDVAKTIEIHNHIRDGDIVRMRRVEGGIAIPPGGKVAIEPGGYHIMLIGLTRTLQEGDRFPMTLVFANQGEVSVEVMVQKTTGDSGHGGDDTPHHSH